MFHPHGTPSRAWVAPTRTETLDTDTLPPPSKYFEQQGRSRVPDITEPQSRVRIAPSPTLSTPTPEMGAKWATSGLSALTGNRVWPIPPTLSSRPTMDSSKRKSGLPPVKLAQTSAAPDLCSISLWKTNGSLDTWPPHPRR